jgi:hypothetical protein
LHHHQNGEQDDGALGEPLEEGLEGQATILAKPRLKAMRGIDFTRRSIMAVMIRYVVGVMVMLAVVPAWAQEPSCKFLCAPSLLIEPTITIENLADSPRVSEDGAATEREKRETVFEFIIALDIPTTVPWLSFALEAIVHPFVETGENPFTGRTSGEVGGDIRDNPVEIESEINFEWLKSERTKGWVSSHFDIVNQFSPAARPRDRSLYTHKLDFELDTAFAIFQRLPVTNWLRNVEIEMSLDYLASGIPKAGDEFGVTRFVDNASPWSFSLVFVIPVIRGQ